MKKSTYLFLALMTILVLFTVPLVAQTTTTPTEIDPAVIETIIAGGILGIGVVALTQLIKTAIGAQGALVSFGGVAPGHLLPVDIGHLHYEEISIQPIYHHTPVDVAEAVRRLAAGEIPVERLITARLPLSELRRALEMVGDRSTLRTILIPEH